MRSIRSVRMKKLVRGNRSRAAKKSKPAPWWVGGRAIAGGVTGLMMVAVIIAAYEPSERTSIASVRAGADETLTESEWPPLAGSSSAPAAARMRQPKTPAADALSTETASDPTLSSVTITGCLERSNDAFRLRDTAGAQAPKARSWKSGFLKKASASVDVVAAAERVSLSNHVGERVSVTGTLVDREIRARSLQRVAPSCAGSAKLRT